MKVRTQLLTSHLLPGLVSVFICIIFTFPALCTFPSPIQARPGNSEFVPGKLLEKGALAQVYEQVAPAVVGIVCHGQINGSTFSFFGTGVIIDPQGTVLTSITVVPSNATQIRIFLKGGKTYTANILKTVENKELSLLQIEVPAVPTNTVPTKVQEDFQFVRLGDSSRVQVGQVSLTLGNAFHSIENDDQVTLAAGLISGNYSLVSLRSQAKYIGPILETTAAVNDGMDGGPLLNDRGEVIGLLSLNFSTNRWLGTAIPINQLKPLLEIHRKWFSDRLQPLKTYIGIELAEKISSDFHETHLQIQNVYSGSPAKKAGLEKGQVLIGIEGKPTASISEYLEHMKNVKPGAKINFQIWIPTPGKTKIKLGDAEEVTVISWGRF